LETSNFKRWAGKGFRVKKSFGRVEIPAEHPLAEKVASIARIKGFSQETDEAYAHSGTSIQP